MQFIWSIALCSENESSRFEKATSQKVTLTGFQISTKVFPTSFPTIERFSRFTKRFSPWKMCENISIGPPSKVRPQIAQMALASSSRSHQRSTWLVCVLDSKSFSVKIAFRKMFNFCLIRLTFTFESLTKQSVQQRAAMIAKCWRHECVHFEAMRQIDFESLT